MFSFGDSESNQPPSCMNGGKKRRTMKKKIKRGGKSCGRCHHRPCTCKKRTARRGGMKKRKGTKKRSMKKRSMKKRSMKKRSMKKRRSMKKGSASKTRRGRKNFITHKGDKDYNARGHRQVKRRSPYSRRR